MVRGLRLSRPSREATIDACDMALSLCCLFIGALYVTSARTGVSYWVAGVLLDIGPLPVPDPLVIRSVLEAAGLHSYIQIRLGIGLVLVGLGGAGILVERPRRATRSLLMVLRAYWNPRGPRRERALSEVLRKRASIAYAEGAVETELLLAGVFNLWLRSVVLFCLIFAAVALAVYTYVRYTESSMASSLVREKLSSYLHEVQLGYVPDRPGTRQTEILGLVGHLGAMPVEKAHLERTMALIQAMDSRASDDDLAVVRMEVEAAIKDVKLGRNERGDPTPAYDRYFYLSHLAAGLYRALAESNLNPNQGTWEWSKMVLAEADRVLAAEQGTKGLAPVFDRLRALRLAQIVQSPEEWDRDPAIGQRLREASAALEKVAAQSLTQEQQARESLNSALVGVVPLRMVGHVGLNSDGFADRRRKACEELRNPDDERSAPRVVDRVLSANEHFVHYFPRNRYPLLTHAEVYASVGAYLLHQGAGGGFASGPSELALRDVLRGHAAGHRQWPVGQITQDGLDSLTAACLAEAIVALDRLGEPRPPWGEESVWLRIEREPSFCYGVFEILKNGDTRGIARRAFELAGVRYPFGLQ